MRGAGLDGVLTVDYPPEECTEFVALLKSRELDPIFLLSPTTEPKRIDTIVGQASGFVYYVSLKGVTGSQNLDIAQVAERLQDIRSKTDLPIGVGFGVRDAATAKQVAAIADAVVVGSRLVQEIENSSEQELLPKLTALTSELRAAIDNH
jgi:tryptophan synthase alpha chain